VESLYLLVPISVVLVFAIGALFWWALQGGQFEDLDGPAYRILMEEDGAEALPVDADQAARRQRD
jgi:cbb3-type cytochrome oxidase maturation protein